MRQFGDTTTGAISKSRATCRRLTCNSGNIYIVTTMAAQLSWLMLAYKVPPDSPAKRIALWRRLKSLGAVYLQNGVCLFPKTAEHVRRLKVLANDVSDMGGAAFALETVGLDKSEEERVVARFKADRDEQYKEFIGRCDDYEAEIAKERRTNKFTYAELDEEETDLKKMQSWFEKIRKLDFYGAPLAKEAEARLRSCEELLESYAQQVFEAQEENRGE